jgi:hypothetical protein
MQEDESTSEIVAVVNTESFTKKDLNSILPEDISEEDSIILVKKVLLIIGQ